ncbi:nitroreductase family deazaflavin-dependent oxidoreductase [Mycobacterium talmoniae]|uniref:Deazaflavin-dependent nitroreductase n=1 Tax=Mycobacterium talmoniae TaxID=1858794 RepID=A0A1S1NJS4_9MYCO|nr:MULTISPECIES: nitroreductase family deazaflavin-dependent oxidoreductase [Mycobacterium]OHV04108.1 deazaflavin-dependent nitroreductase [Mycobacterium talmoniae]PQM47355.1 Deazaflavin-dependent nitroreductase [Mycobacterium talmoniae]TDH52675.1 nitroreductase family deazaflavin-dependent oxidoreductase [Mycobacterium eburneum]
MAQQIPDADTIKAFNTSIVEEFRGNGGKVGGQFAGADLLLLTTTGAKSGQPRVAPLAYLRIDGKLIIIGSYAGADIHPAWVHNLRAHPRAHVEIGTESFEVTARELPPAERDAVFPQIVAAAPGFADYQAKTTRVIPLFELQPTG